MTDPFRIGCNYTSEPRWRSTEDTLCKNCSAPIQYDPAMVRVIDKKYPKHGPIEFWCMGCLGRQIADAPEKDYRIMRDVLREVLGPIVDEVGVDWLRDKARKASKQ